MPIRFRCVYCNQLLGISRRKAGTIVRCTTCEGQLIVPEPDDGVTDGGSHEHAPQPQPDHPTKTANGGTGGVFDAEEFDAFLEPLNPGSPAAVASPPAPTVRPLPSAPAPAPVVEPAAGLTLSPLVLTIVAVVAVFALGLSFGGGLLLGLALK
jgi:hypothetical protein